MTRKMSCEDVMSMLYAYLDSEVDGPTEDDINAHLHECRECFSRADFEKALRKKIQNAGEMATPTETRSRLESLIKRF
jgi:anti-sigma factor (TIGR02949 family)